MSGLEIELEEFNLRLPHNWKTCHLTSLIGRIKKAREKRVKVLFFICKYSNLLWFFSSPVVLSCWFYVDSTTTEGLYEPADCRCAVDGKENSPDSLR